MPSTAAVPLPSREAASFLRRRAGLTQRELAKLVGVRQHTISQWESGARVPRGDLADRYVLALFRLTPEAKVAS